MRDTANSRNISHEQSENSIINIDNARNKIIYENPTIYRVNYQKGAVRNKTAFVFSCPGKTEMSLGTVCAGKTGSNLSMLLKFCHQKRPDIFSSCEKYDYLITNASDIVHYKKLTNDTEPGDDEILAKENLCRLQNELKCITTVICMGERAKKAITNARLNGRVILFNHHLSNQKLNRIYPNDRFDETLSAGERRKERIRLVSEELLKMI